MKSEELASLEGGCTCGAIRYRLTASPLFVHCCHCRWCQRETGSAFALNAMIEASEVELLQGNPVQVVIPSNSGKGQKMTRCPECQITVWSNYGGAGDVLHFVRVGTLDHPDSIPPDIHIFTESKQPWVVLDDEVPVMPRYYSAKEHWPPQSLERMMALKKGG